MNSLNFISKIAATFCLVACVSTPSAAEIWPAPGRPIQIIVPAPGGGGTGDAIARLLGDQLSTRLGVSVYIDNKPGANGNLGAATAAQAAPDGQRLLFSWAGTLAVNPSLYDQLGFDPVRSFTPIALVGDVPNIVVVNNDLPAKTFDDFVRLAKATQGKLNYGSSGVGSSMHLAGELFKRETGADMLHVPYTAPGRAVTSLIGNDIQVMFQLVPGVAGLVTTQKIRALAVMSKTRSSALPQVPTTVELGYPKLLSSTWFALLAPKGTPDAIVDRLNTEVNKILATPEVKSKMQALGVATLGGSRQALATQIDEEASRWAHIIKENGIKPQ